MDTSFKDQMNAVNITTEKVDIKKQDDEIDEKL